MNKGDLVKVLVPVLGKKKQAEEVVGCLLNTITDALRKGDSVVIYGFGSFKVFERAARTVRNPQTGKAIKIKAKRVPRFSAAKKLKDAVEGRMKGR
ncbi:MAG TPA: HU family DNA-binding protein [Syntrophales bacterium]|nr:HU family DNA-binding protein [Syntrophales bacterium]